MIEKNNNYGMCNDIFIEINKVYAKNKKGGGKHHMIWNFPCDYRCQPLSVCIVFCEFILICLCVISE